MADLTATAARQMVEDLKGTLAASAVGFATAEIKGAIRKGHTSIKLSHGLWADDTSHAYPVAVEMLRAEGFGL